MRILPAVLALDALLILGCFRVGEPDVAFPDTFRPDVPESESFDTSEDDTGGAAPSWTRYEYNFDELEAGIIDTHYAEFSVEADDGAHMVVYPATTLARSQPNCLYVAADAGAAGSTAAFRVRFARPVRGLRFFAGGDTTTAESGLAEVAGIDIELASGEPVVAAIAVDGNPSTAELVDLSAYEGIVALQVRDIFDPSGLAYDDLSFEMRDP